MDHRRGEGRRAQERYLLAGVSESFARGHYRVALRRYFMLVAREFDVPDELQPEIERAASIDLVLADVSWLLPVLGVPSFSVQ